MNLKTWNNLKYYNLTNKVIRALSNVFVVALFRIDQVTEMVMQLSSHMSATLSTRQQYLAQEPYAYAIPCIQVTI